MDYERAYGWKSNTFNESEMALFSECMQSCARKVLDTADIVREACYRKLPAPTTFASMQNKRLRERPFLYWLTTFTSPPPTQAEQRLLALSPSVRSRDPPGPQS